MQKADIEQLWDLEVAKSKRIFQTPVSNDEVYITALDYSDEIVIVRSKIESISETGIILVVNPDRAARDGELYQLVALNALKLVMFTHKSVSEADIEEQLDIVEEDEAEEEEEGPEEEDTGEYVED
ncbi:MAG: hypothetical protein LUQ65_11620 [Candidatus Helarchaeota archaeon]|nr:hypothetical protein [Candidatus Helarchaeota archaeon]